MRDDRRFAGARAATAAAASLAAAGAWWGPGAAAHWRPLAGLLAVPLRRPGGAGVTLTFDDGPHPRGTPAVLDALAAAGARATFFLVGEQVERHRALTAELVAAGHEVAVHAHRHRSQMRLGPRAFADDLRRGVAAIADATGRAPLHYRPPYGAFTLGGLATVRRFGLRPMLWSRWGRDWDRRSSPERIAALALREIGAGDVVLLHDADWYCSPGAYRNTVAALPRILTELDRRALPAVGLGGGVPAA